MRSIFGFQELCGSYFFNNLRNRSVYNILADRNCVRCTKLCQLCVSNTIRNAIPLWFACCQRCSRSFPASCRRSKVQLSIWVTRVIPSCRLPVSLKSKQDNMHKNRHKHIHTEASRPLRPKPQALLLVSIVMSISLLSSGLKGWPYFVMWLFYWAWSALVAPSTIQ